MANADRATDTPIELEFNGRKYKVRQITTQDYGEITRHLKTLYIGEVAKSLRFAGISEDKVIETVQKLQLEEWGIKDEKHYEEKIRPLLESIDAIGYILYVSLRKEHPELTVEDVREIVAQNPDRMTDIVVYVMGGEVRKNPKKSQKEKKE